MKSIMKKDMGVSPVIAVILMVAITVVLAGVVFLWAQSFTEDAGGGVDTLSVDMEILDGEDDWLIITSLKGDIDWSDYTIKVEGTEETPGNSTTDVGVDEYVPITITPTVGEDYNVKIISVDDKSVIIDSEVTCKAE